jgi:uncharacterized damage-inducible protein DinB
MSVDSVHRYYAGWDGYNEQIIAALAELGADQLAIRPAPDGWPLWATVGHMAGMRVYWLCGVLGEPGSEDTPFPDPLSEIGWEDDLARPRSSDELVGALQSTWRLLEGCLDRWTPDELDEAFARPQSNQLHTRQSVLMRMLSHDAYHCGEMSQTLGIHGLTQIDLWPA